MDYFKKDLKFINEYCQNNADSLYRCAVGVHATVQQDTQNLDNILTQYDRLGFVDGDVFDWRKNYINHFSENRQYYYDNMMKILRSKKDVADRILALFLEADGLGLAKASFLALLATGNKSFSCLDSNLLKWYGLDRKITDYNKKTKCDNAKKKRRQEYLSVVSKLGGGIKLYKEWCINVADKSKKFKSGYQVSMKHRHWFTTWENQYPTL